MTKREEREHLFKLLFCKDFHDVEELKEQVELYQDQQEVGKEEEFAPVKAKLEAIKFQIFTIQVVLSQYKQG